MQCFGFYSKINGENDQHKKEMSKKERTRTVAKQAWNIGERKFELDFNNRRIILEYLVQSILTYEAEI